MNKKEGLPVVEILLSTYNGEKYIAAQIDSILGQTYTEWILKIRDDKSTDQTVEILRSYVAKYPNKIILLESDNSNIGSTLSFAKLIEFSTADYIMLCDQDDVWLEYKVELSLKKIQEKENEYGKNKALLVFSDLKEVDQDLSILNESFWISQKYFLDVINDYKKTIALNIATGCTMIFNIAAKQYILPMPPYVVHDMWITINIAYYGKLFYIEQPLILYRQHSLNAIGAHKIGFKYFKNKINYTNLKIYFQIKKDLSFRISIFQLLFYKLLFSIKRLWK
jgi:glycosyltransferase involved in cell wall biosynthesis